MQFDLLGDPIPVETVPAPPAPAAAARAAKVDANDGPQILVGTASWTDPTLIKCKRFYPAGCSSAEARLRFYASVFPIVEVNSSYYAMPSRSNSQLWAERTPAAFVFNVKAFRLFTGHQTPVNALPVPIRASLGTYSKKNIYYKDMPAELRDVTWVSFMDAIEPLREAGKLGAIHFQFAPWFVYSAEAIAHVEKVRKRLADYTLSIEFRHQSWFSEKNREQTLDMQRSLRLVNVVLDEPQGFTNSVGQHWEVTNPQLAIVRLHGRNIETWNIKGATVASDRFNYDYSDAELEGLAGSIRQLAMDAMRVHVIFNNNYEDQGQRNARSLMGMLGPCYLARHPTLP